MTTPTPEQLPGQPPSHDDLAALAARHDLPKLGGRPSLPDYVRQLWGRRHFCFELARLTIKVLSETLVLVRGQCSFPIAS